MLSLIQCDRVDLLDDFRPKETLAKDTRLFVDDLKTTTDVSLSSEQFPDHEFSFETTSGLWQGTQPWEDRADGPRAIEKLILFAHNTTIVDHLEVRSKHLHKYGFDKNSIQVKLRNSLGEVIADFSIGKASAWKKKIEGKQELLVPTVYLRRNDLGDKNTLYLCTDFSGGIHKLFTEQLKSFRDHRPFALNIQTLKQVRLLRGKTEIELSHAHPAAPWMLKKPLELNSDRKQVMAFLANLSKLEAIALHSRQEVVLPDSQDDVLQVAISNFNSEEETLLTVYPAENGSGSCYATVSNRDIIFELPLISTPKVANYITQLPESINELRSKNMLHLGKSQRADLKSIFIRTPVAPDEAVIISRLPDERYQLLSKQNTKESIDELVLVELLTRLTKSPVKDFTSDATSDFSQFGLEQPLMLIDLLFFQSKQQQLRIGKVLKKNANQELEEKFYANLRGEPIVWEVSSDFVSQIPTRYWDWQPREIWNLPVIDIVSFSAQRAGREKVTVNYDYFADDFTATIGDRDVSNRLRPSRAKFYLNENHALSAHKRLSPHDKAASEALKTPIFTTTITVKEFDEEGFEGPPSLHTLKLAKVSQTGNNAFYYAQSSDTPGYFLLSLDTVRKLAAIDLFDEE